MGSASDRFDPSFGLDRNFFLNFFPDTSFVLIVVFVLVVVGFGDDFFFDRTFFFFFLVFLFFFCRVLPDVGDDAYSASLVLLRESFDILSLCVLSLLLLLLSYSFHDGNFSKSLCLFWTETLCILDVSFSGDSTKFTTGTLILTAVFFTFDFPFIDFFGPLSFLLANEARGPALFGRRERTKSGDCSPRRTSVAQTLNHLFLVLY